MQRPKRRREVKQRKNAVAALETANGKKMAAQLDQQDDETSEIVLRAACADGGLDRLLLQLRMRCHPSRTALITYAESYLRAPTRADVLWRLREEREVLLDGAGGDAADAPFCSSDALDEAPRQIVLIGERNPMRAKGKVARTRRRRASELAGTDYDGALKFLQGLGYATKAPARTVRGRRYVHRSGTRITLLRVEGTPGYLVEFSLLGDDEASLLELRESLPVAALD